jgi:hypothetical protein
VQKVEAIVAPSRKAKKSEDVMAHGMSGESAGGAKHGNKNGGNGSGSGGNGSGNGNGNGSSGVEHATRSIEVSEHHTSSVSVREEGHAQVMTESQSLTVSMREMQADAPACDVCGTITVRSGTCYKCLNCGNSMGCS